MLIIAFNGFAQVEPLTTEEKAALDSMLKQDDLVQMLLNDESDQSFFQVKATIGNSYFSVKNKRINATQLENKIVYTGSAGYTHKSGFGLTGSAYLTNFNNRSGVYQYAITPSYSYNKSKKVEGAVSYTRFIRVEGFEKAASPIQNDIYANLNLKKPWLQPGLAIGYADGKYTQYKKIDTIILGTRRIFIDTMTTTLSNFSLNAFVQHEFEWYKVFHKKDGIAFSPAFYLNAGSGKYNVTHRNKFFNKLNERPDALRNVGSVDNDNSFTIQSMAANLDATYVIGKFGIRTQAYFDYYLPETTDKRFTSIFSCSFSYIFY